ncbi:hypothetical protein LTR39_006952, partial [Cryomyces antarcticus]
QPASAASSRAKYRARERSLATDVSRSLAVQAVGVASSYQRFRLLRPAYPRAMSARRLSSAERVDRLLQDALIILPGLHGGVEGEGLVEGSLQVTSGPTVRTSSCKLSHHLGVRVWGRERTRKGIRLDAQSASSSR